jgi:hypothetical protein
MFLNKKYFKNNYNHTLKKKKIQPIEWETAANQIL